MVEYLEEVQEERQVSVWSKRLHVYLARKKYQGKIERVLTTSPFLNKRNRNEGIETVGQLQETDVVVSLSVAAADRDERSDALLLADGAAGQGGHWKGARG